MPPFIHSIDKHGDGGAVGSGDVMPNIGDPVPTVRSIVLNKFPEIIGDPIPTVLSVMGIWGATLNEGCTLFENLKISFKRQNKKIGVTELAHQLIVDQNCQNFPSQASIGHFDLLRLKIPNY